MTDNEIIKALEYCANHKDCDDGCPCVISESPCVVNNPCTLLNLINRQKAEIERLHSMNQAKLDMLHDIRAELEIAKSEAIREFAEKLKCKLADHKFECNDKTFEEVGNWLIHKVAGDVINELVKEMTEGENAETNKS